MKKKNQLINYSKKIEYEGNLQYKSANKNKKYKCENLLRMIDTHNKLIKSNNF